MSGDAEGLVIGKFLPPHRGHHLLIDTAAARCAALTVVVGARSTEPIPLERRVAWLRDRHPEVVVHGFVDDHPVDFDDDATWQYWADTFLAQWRAAGPGRATGRPDVLFSSEPYGDELAARIGCRHEAVDPARGTVPVSGTAVREDPLAAWDHLEPAVRAWFVKRVVLIGAESTGKTTLAGRLAERFGTTWVPEFGRAYSEDKLAADGSLARWDSDEFVMIGRRQAELEDAAALEADRVLICDTDPLATIVWHGRYVGGAPPLALVEQAEGRAYDLYLLASPAGVPWVDDGVRDGADVRERMHAEFVAELARQHRPVVVLDGTWAEREATAVAAIEAVLADPWAGRSYRPEEPGDRARRFTSLGPAPSPSPGSAGAGPGPAT